MRFRFAVSAPRVGTLADWRREVGRIEDAGFDSLVVADHFTEGWGLEPMVALTAAAMATTTLRLQTGVLANDYRHPVLTHRMAATIDQLSGGRFTLGLGGGWLRTEYEAAGIPFDPPGVRVTRLEEAVAVIKGLFSGKPLDHRGVHYDIDGLVGVPAAVQHPHPPLLLGGGSPRVLRLAGREADIVSIVASLRAGRLGSHAVSDLSEESVAEKLTWVDEGMAVAGRSGGEVVRSINHWLVRVVATESEGEAFLARVAARAGVQSDLLRRSPAVLVGTVPHLADTLIERRERYGFSHLQLDAGFPPDDLAALFPLVARLSGS